MASKLMHALERLDTEVSKSECDDMKVDKLTKEVEQELLRTISRERKRKGV